MQFAPSRNDRQRNVALYANIYAAYFPKDRDIGSLDTLIDIAAAYAFDMNEVRAYLLSASGDQAIDDARNLATQRGIHAVPTIAIAGDVTNGAQPAAVFVSARRLAQRRSAAWKQSLSLARP